MSNAVLLTLAFVVLLGWTVVVVGCGCSRPGTVVDATEVQGTSFDLRILRRGKTVTGPDGGWYYEFQSRRRDATDWQSIVTVQHDDF